jgi:repressor LexA
MTSSASCRTWQKFKDGGARPSNRALRRIPLIGQIPAGDPRPAEQSADGIFPLPRQLVGNGVVFLLKVTGNSMIGAAIVDGDWIVVRRQPEAHSGDIVAAMIDGEATVKTFRRSGGEIWLEPHNPDFIPIPGRNATILGKVVAVLRQL